MTDRFIPDFLGIGAIKCGTTWLFRQLDAHPQLALPRTKELEFFDSRYELGWEWYRSCFPDPEGRCTGEISPQYLHSPKAVERIRALAGNVRLLVLLRNPIDRAYSHFNMDSRSLPLKPSELQEAFHKTVVRGESKYVLFGEYARQLRPLIGEYDNRDIWFGMYDDLQGDPAGLVKSVYQFLGVDSDFSPEGMTQRVNQSREYRSRSLFLALQRLVQFAERSGMAKIITRIKVSGFRDRVLRWLEVPRAYPTMSPATREILLDHYFRHNRDLANLVGLDLSSWDS